MHLVDITVIAGSLDNARRPPGADSWASKATADVAIWHVRSAPVPLDDARRRPEDTVRVLYVFDGSCVTVDGQDLDVPTGIVVDAGRRRRWSLDDGVECW
jgi:quercetin 2,3-dioxygenase